MLVADDDRRISSTDFERSTPGRGKGRLLPQFEIVTIMSNPRECTPLLSLAPIFRPWDAEDGWDYDCVFSDEPDVYGGFQDAYGCYRVDRSYGCLVVCRPDQHVAFVGALGVGGTAELDKFCGSIFL
jgi:phenol 2-monooxygenase